MNTRFPVTLVLAAALFSLGCGGDSEESPEGARTPVNTAQADTGGQGGPNAGPDQDKQTKNEGVQSKSQSNQQQGPPPLVMKPHTVRDPGSRNMESHTILAPKGWAVEGGAYWASQQYFSILPSQDISVKAPDGRLVRIGPTMAAVDFLPSPQSMQFGAQRPAKGSADNGYPVVYMPQSLPEWRQWMQKEVLPAEYPKAKKIQITNVVVIPELTQLLKRQMAPMRQQQQRENQQWAALGSAERTSGDESVLAFEWTYVEDGKPYNSLIVLATTYTATESQVGTQFWWTIERSITFRAPMGTLEKSMPLLMAIENSLRVTPQWAQMRAEHSAAMNRIAAKGAADRAAIAAQTNREINQMINDGWKERNRIMDATHEKFINTIRGVENYTTPGSSTQVSLPSGYGHVYSNANGEYLLTNDALFNPNTDPVFNGTNWDTMKVLD